MKYCSKCGTENSEGAAFCKLCGSALSNNEKSENVAEQAVNTVPNSSQVKQKKEGLGVASLVIGIVAIVFAFIFNVFVIPLAFIGLILGIINKVTKGKKFAGIILNGVAILVSIIIFILVAALIGTFATSEKTQNGFLKFLNELYNELDYSSSDNYLEGTWDCKKFDGSGEADDYSVTMILNKDKTFKYGKYGDLENNHAGGTYTYEDEKDKNETVVNGYKYFMVTLEGNKNDYIYNGVDQNKEFKSEFEIGITAKNTKKEGIMIFPSTYNMYYCYRR